VGDLKPLSDLAKSIWQVLVDRHSGAENAIPRERLYRFISSWDEYRNVRGGKPVSFRAFRSAKQELVAHRFRVGSSHQGWFRILTTAEASASAAYLAPHIEALVTEQTALEAMAMEIEQENKEQSVKGQQGALPLALFQDDGTENIAKRLRGEIQ